MIYFYSFLTASLFSVIFVWGLLKLGVRYKILSRPRKRDIHRKPVPRIGGLGIYLSFFLVSVFVLLVFAPDMNFNSTVSAFGIESHLWAIWLGSSFIALSMFFDDLYGLKASQKMIIQIISTIIIIGLGVGIDFISNPFGGGAINLNSIYIPIFVHNGVVYHFSLWSDLLTLIWMVGMMNVMNFVDGVDGLAGGQGFIAAIAIFMLSISTIVDQPATALISIILAGATLGFLFLNFPPAKIFMGDSGSMFLGFVLGLLALISGGKLATVFLVMGYPIIDGLIVAINRIVHGKNPFTTPDKTHLHHRFLDAGFTPRQSILVLYLISIFFGLAALVSGSRGKIISMLLLVFVIVTLMVLLGLVKRFQRKKTIL